MQLGETVKFHSCERDWVLKPFTLGVWFEFCKWCKANIDDDPLARISRVPLDKLSKEAADEMVRAAIAEDRLLNDYRPESESTIKRLGTPAGMTQAIYLLAGGAKGEVTQEQCDTMVSSFVMNGQAEVLVGYLRRAMGISDADVASEKKVA